MRTRVTDYSRPNSKGYRGNGGPKRTWPRAKCYECDVEWDMRYLHECDNCKIALVCPECPHHCPASSAAEPWPAQWWKRARPAGGADATPEQEQK